MANWQAQISIDIDDLKKRIKVAEGELDKIEKKEHKVKLDIDTKTLENAVIKLDRMLESLGKGSGDFKEFENLSKQLSSITTDINNISKAFSVMNDGSDFANSIKSIDTSLTALSNHFVSEMSGRMTSSIKEVKSTLSDVGDGGELAPLLQTINKIENAINELSTSVKGIGLNMNIDVGSDSEMEAKVQSKIANALQAYQRLFDAIKMSGAGGSIINTNFFEFDINQYDTMMGKLQAYKKFIDNMRKEAKIQYNGKDILYQSVDKSYWTQASSAMGQVTKAFNEMNTASDSNPLSDMFGKTDLSEVISQLGLIVTKLEEISNTASSFKNVFDNGFNVTASVEEIDNLTNRVKELEDELSKIKLNPVNIDKSNISSENSIVEDQNKIQEELKETQEQAEETSKTIEKIISAYRGVDDKELIGKQSKNYGGKTFFTTSKELASEYGSEVFKADLLFKNLLDFDAEGSNWNKIKVPKIIEDYLNNIIDLSKEKINEAKIELKNIIGDGFQDIPFDKLLIKTNAINGETSLKKGYHKYANNFEEYWGQIKTIFEGLDNEEPIKIALEKLYNAMKLATSNMLQVVNNNNIIDVIGRKDGRYATDQIIGLAEKLGYDGTLIRNVYDNPASSNKEILDNILAAFSKNQFHNISPMKDVFQDDDKINTDASTTAIKEESRALEQVSTSAKDAATSKEKFANANKEVKASAESSSAYLNEEKKKFENVGDSAEETKKKLDDVVFKPNTEGFDEIVSKLDIAKDKIEEISKITKSSVWSESQGEYLESYNIKYKNGTSEIRGESSNKKGSNVLRANEVAYDAKAAEQEAKAVKEVWDKNVKAIQDYMDAVTKLNNLNAKDKGTGKYASQIALQEKNVEELKEKALEARTAITSMINPHDVPLNTWRDYLDVMEKFSQASLGSAESVAKLEDALRKMDFSSLESAGTKFKSQFDNLSIKPDGDHQFLSWTNDLKELNIKIEEYSSKVKYLKENNIVDGEQVDEVKKLRDEIEETINVMSKTSQAKRGWTDIGASKAAEKVANVLKQNTKMSKEAKDAIRAYYNELRSGNPSQPIDEILVKVNQLVQKERELGRVGKSFGEIFKEKVIYGGAAQLAGMVGFYDVINVGREGFQTIRELDTALTEMKKVSDETTQSLKNYQATTFDVGDTVGATAKTIQDSTADWMRLGESINEAAESAKASNILLNVSEFESIDEATESLVAMSQAYSELGKMDIIDVLNNIGNNYSIATDGLATALQKSASALKTANNDLNSAVALATAGNAVVQDPDSVGAGIRTISLRLVGTEAAKQELESIGEETDDVITTTSKLRDTILSATAAATNDGKGFDIFDSNGNYKSTYEIMQGLADLYDDIVAKDKELGTNNLNLLLETIAGKNRSNIAASILQNGEMLRSVYQDAQNSSGSAQKELDSYLDSIDGRMTQLENRAQEFWYKVIDSDTIKNGITLLTDLLELVTNIVDTFGLLGTAAGIGGVVAGFKNVGINTLVAY